MNQVKQKYRCLLALVVMVGILTGCGKKELTTTPSNVTNPVNNTTTNMQDSESSATDSENTAEGIAAETTTLEQSKGITFSYKDLLPVIVNGKTIAFARINQFERVGIYDWYNAKAVEKNIKHSYSLNLSIINKEDTVLTVDVTPTLVDKQDTEVSSKCKVGWTGFNESAEFYGKGNIPVEVGMQPEIRTEKDLKLKLVFNTSKGDSEPVIVANSIFKHVVIGPNLKESGDETKIKSVNGAKYAFTIGKVYKEQNSIDLSPVTAVEFDNRIQYLKTPTKKLEVATFDSKKKHAMYANLMIGMQTQHNSTLLYEHNQYAARPDYYGDFTDYYASDVDKVLKVGRSVKYQLNRVLPEGSESEQFVRFCVEFPADAEVASLKDMLKFNGRFIVYQCEAHKRTIKYEG